MRAGAVLADPDCAAEVPARPRSAVTLVLLGVSVLAGVVLLTSLGIWQVERRAWKLDLIARVEQRLRVPPVEAPARGGWHMVGPGDEYRRVRATGRFLPGRETLVQAVTARGAGYWVMAPLRLASGETILINRGFVPSDRQDATAAPLGEVAITGLMRRSEPKGAFLRDNDPPEGRWFSRDVAAIAAARGLGETAPYFIDADGAPDPDGSSAPQLPIGGLTVVRFANNHLIYAITWFGLDLMLIGAAIVVARHEWRLRRRIAI